MQRRRSLLCDVFQIDLHSKENENTLNNSNEKNTVIHDSAGSTGSDINDVTIDDDGYTILPPPSMSNKNSSRFMRSHSLDVSSLNNSSRGVWNIRTLLRE